jgi:hypothetical protein
LHRHVAPKQSCGATGIVLTRTVVMVQVCFGGADYLLQFLSGVKGRLRLARTSPPIVVFRLALLPPIVAMGLAVPLP